MSSSVDEKGKLGTAPPSSFHLQDCSPTLTTLL